MAGNGGLRNLQLASALQTTSRWVLLVALLLVAYQHGGALAVGAIAVVRTLCALATIPVAAAIGGRRRERVLLLLAAVRAMAAAGAAVAFALGLPGALFVAAGVDSFVGTLRRPLHAGLMPSLAGTPEELVAANVATNLGENSGSLVGPIVGGALLALAGPAGALLLAALGFASAAVLLAAVRDVHPGLGAASSGSRPAAYFGFRGLASGARALAETHGVRLVGALLLLDAFLRGALGTSIVVVAVAGLGYGGAAVGFLMGMPGLGGLVGVGVALSLLSDRRLGVSLGSALLVAGLGAGLFGLAPGIALAACALVVVGSASAIADVAATTRLQRSVPRWDRTRIFGALEGLAEGAVGLGAVTASIAITAVGVRAATTVGGSSSRSRPRSSGYPFSAGSGRPLLRGTRWSSFARHLCSRRSRSTSSRRSLGVSFLSSTRPTAGSSPRESQGTLSLLTRARLRGRAGRGSAPCDSRSW